MESEYRYGILDIRNGVWSSVIASGSLALLLLFAPSPLQAMTYGDTEFIDIIDPLPKDFQKESQVTKPKKKKKHTPKYSITKEQKRSIDYDIFLNNSKKNFVNIPSLKGTPLWQVGVPRNCKYLLGEMQCNEILKLYNGGESEKNLGKFELIFPNVVDSLLPFFPENLDDFITRNPSFKEKVGDSSDVVLISKTATTGSVFAYYKEGKLFMATRTTLGEMGSFETPQGIYFVKGFERYKASKKHKITLPNGEKINAPMPYAVLFDDDGDYIHAGNVGPNNYSHGCGRLPGLFSIEFYKNVKKGTKVVIDLGIDIIGS